MGLGARDPLRPLALVAHRAYGGCSLVEDGGEAFALSFFYILHKTFSYRSEVQIQMTAFVFFCFQSIFILSFSRAEPSQNPLVGHRGGKVCLNCIYIREEIRDLYDFYNPTS